MKRVNILFLLFLIAFLSCALLDVEAKSKDKSKEKYSKKSKTEGSPKEVKHRYSKHSQKSEEYSQSQKENEKEADESPQQSSDEVPPQENNKKPESIQKTNKQKKERKPYTISVELVEEPISEIKTRKEGNQPNVEDNSDTKINNQLKKKATKQQGNRIGKKLQSSNSQAEDTADFIVHVPKNKKGTRQVLVFQVPAQDNESNEEEELENAVQQYINEEQDTMIEDDCGCVENSEEQSIHDKRSSNDVCYY